MRVKMPVTVSVLTIILNAIAVSCIITQQIRGGVVNVPVASRSNDISVSLSTTDATSAILTTNFRPSTTRRVPPLQATTTATPPTPTQPFSTTTAVPLTSAIPLTSAATSTSATPEMNPPASSQRTPMILNTSTIRPLAITSTTGPKLFTSSLTPDELKTTARAPLTTTAAASSGTSPTPPGTNATPPGTNATPPGTSPTLAASSSERATTALVRPVRVQRPPTRLAERLEGVDCDVPLLPNKSRLWRGNETHELSLPIMVSTFS